MNKHDEYLKKNFKTISTKVPLIESKDIDKLCKIKGVTKYKLLQSLIAKALREAEPQEISSIS